MAGDALDKRTADQDDLISRRVELTRLDQPTRNSATHPFVTQMPRLS